MPILEPTFADVIDPGQYGLREAVAVARQLREKGIPVPARLASALQTEADLGRAERVLEILPHVTPRGQLVEILNQALPLTEARVRSRFGSYMYRRRRTRVGRWTTWTIRTLGWRRILWKRCGVRR